VRLVSHPREHLLEVGETKLDSVVLAKRRSLLRGDCAGLDGVLLEKKACMSQTKACATSGGSSVGLLDIN
jgi:hypothetical protein